MNSTNSNAEAPLRNYRQMIRIVRNTPGASAQYQLANTFGDSKIPTRHTDLRLRTLDELNLPSTTQRRPGPIDSGGVFSTRTASSYYHQLNSNSRNYLNGIGGPQAKSRLDNLPGTKTRETLGSSNYIKKIVPQVNFQPPVMTQKQPKPTQASTTKNLTAQSKKDKQYSAFSR